MLSDNNKCSARGFNGNIANITGLFSLDVTLGVSSKTWEGDLALMICTSNLDIVRV